MSDGSSGGDSIFTVIASIVGVYIAYNLNQFTTWANGVGDPWGPVALLVVWLLAIYGVLVLLLIVGVFLFVLVAAAVVIGDKVTA